MTWKNINIYVGLLVIHSILCSFHVFARTVRSVPVFQSGIVGKVTWDHITEASGLAASRKHPGIIYTHNDHGGDHGIFAISADGQKKFTLHLKGVKEHDIEDIAYGKCSNMADSEYCIYIGDTGNSGGHAANNIYRIREPDRIDEHDIDVHIHPADTLEFSWSEPDCETLMVDNVANVYIVSKANDGRGVIAKLPNQAWGTQTRVDISSSAVIGVVSHHNDPVSGDISSDGTRVLIKTHDSIYYWDADGTTDYVALLQTPGAKVPYVMEHQGEAVCWDATGSGYYTLGEGKNEPLYHYVKG